MDSSASAVRGDAKDVKIQAGMYHTGHVLGGQWLQEAGYSPVMLQARRIAEDYNQMLDILRAMPKHSQVLDRSSLIAQPRLCQDGHRSC